MVLQENQSQKLLKFIEYFFIIFIAFQPILDITAFFGSSLSIVIRVLAMLVGFVYLFLYPNKKVRLLTTIYLILLGIFMISNIANNYFVKSPFFLTEELTFNIKSAYVVEMIIVFAFVFLSLSKRISWEKIVQRTVFISMSIVGIVMVLATIFDSGKRSYGALAKEGHSGWFFSANELSAILSLGFGLMILYMLNKESIRIKLMLLPGILVVAWSMLMVGTKVGLGAALLLLGTGIIMTLIGSFLNKNQLPNLIILASILILSVIYIPYSPVGNNINFTLLTQNGENGIMNDNKNPSEDEESKRAKDDELAKMALSGRGDFLKRTFEQYKDAPVSQKLLGMGPGGNYKQEPKLVEMDFFDWFFGYGIIGSILLFAPFVYFGSLILKRLFKYKFKHLNFTFLIVGIEVIIGLGIAFLAGHVLLAPASGIYLSILLGYSYVLVMKQDSNDHKN
ncbi:O-antigen ligase family protein [Virgibacillus sp. L01]|uniref:O-antigen ligase family protein n=1 Tax=Virgibacillus sp. L01 TaxID=3457429 RepID=UPI003FD1CD77